MLLNLLQSKSAPGGSAQFAQTVGSKMSLETLQQLTQALPPGQPLESDRPPEPPPLPKVSKPPQPPRTPPMPKPPSPPSPQPPGDGEASAAATQTAVTMLLAQLLKVQQGAAGEVMGFEAAEGGISNAPEPPPEPSPVSPGNVSTRAAQLIEIKSQS